jgi:hypothetical protein
VAPCNGSALKSAAPTSTRRHHSHRDEFERVAANHAPVPLMRCFRHLWLPRHSGRQGRRLFEQGRGLWHGCEVAQPCIKGAKHVIGHVVHPLQAPSRRNTHTPACGWLRASNRGRVVKVKADASTQDH